MIGQQEENCDSNWEGNKKKIRNREGKGDKNYDRSGTGKWERKWEKKWEGKWDRKIGNRNCKVMDLEKKY